MRITITVDPRIKFGLRKRDSFVKKMSFSRVFSVTMSFFSPIILISFIDPCHQRIAKLPDVGSCQSTKIETFFNQIP